MAKTLVFLCSLTLIGLHAFVIYILPEITPERWEFLKRTWGFHFWTFYPDYIAISLYAVAVTVTIPCVNKTAAKWIKKFTASISEYIQNPRLFYGVLCLLSWSIFYLGQQKYGLLGDGYLLASNIIAEHYSPRSIGSLFMLISLQKWIGHWDNTGVLTIQLFSIFWGGLYVVLVCAWTNHICNLSYEKLLCAVLMIFIGSLQFFFGYIETYAPLPFFMLGFLLSGLISLRNNKPPVWATAFFIAGTIMHILLIFFSPALLFLWWRHLSPRFPILRDYRTIILIVVIALLSVYAFGTKHAHILLPLFPSTAHPYGMLTWWHVWEYINAQFLSAPMAWPLLFLFVFARHVLNREIGFLVSSAAGTLTSLFVVNLVLGSLDWDIMALSGVPLMGIATYAIYNGGIQKPFKRYASVLACTWALLLIVPGIYINHTDRSIDRFIQILDGDPGEYHLSHPPEMTMAIAFEQAGLDSLAITYYKKAYQKSPLDRRMPFNIGMVFFRKDKYLESIPYFLQALELSPNYKKVLESLVWLIIHVPTSPVAIENYFHQQYSHSIAQRQINVAWIILGYHAIKTKRLQQVHNLTEKESNTVLQQAQFYISQRDTNRAARILKHALLGDIQQFREKIKPSKG